jgi:hypothetical protein
LDAFCSAIEIEQSKYDGDATDDDFNFREDFLKDIDLMLKTKLKDVEAEGFKKFFWLVYKFLIIKIHCFRYLLASKSIHFLCPFS